jgi:DNA N-6-adenine-methyltransferase (Dam)
MGGSEQGELNFMSRRATQKPRPTRPRGRPRLHARRVLTNAERCRRYRQKRQQRVYWRHEADLWSTPQDFFNRLDAEFHFTLDACAIVENAKCDRYFTPAQDGLQQEWNGGVQPPV